MRALIGVPINIAMLISLIIDMYAFEEEYDYVKRRDTQLEEGVATYLKKIF